MRDLTRLQKSIIINVRAPAYRSLSPIIQRGGCGRSVVAAPR